MAISGNFDTALLSLVEDLVTADKVNINEAIFQQTFGVGNFVSAHSLRTGVRHGGVIPIVLNEDNYCAMPVADNDCSKNECDLPTNYDGKKWDLGTYNCRVPICMKSLDENFLAFWNTYKQGLNDPLTTPDAQALLNYLTGKVEQNILAAQWRVGYWGDTSVTSNNLINGNNGYFVLAHAGNGTKINVDPAGTAMTGQEWLDAIYTAIETASENDPWFSASDLVIKMDFGVAYKIINTLNRLGLNSPYNCDCVYADGYVNAQRFTVEGLRIAGIRVEAHREIGLAGKAVCVGATSENVLIAKKSELLVGTNHADRLDELDIFFDKKDRKIYIDYEMQMGVMLPTDDYILLTTDPVTT